MGISGKLVPKSSKIFLGIIEERAGPVPLSVTTQLHQAQQALPPHLWEEFCPTESPAVSPARTLQAIQGRLRLPVPMLRSGIQGSTESMGNHRNQSGTQQWRKKTLGLWA